MTGNASSYRQIIERFRAFATGHYNLGANRFTHGQIDIADLDKEGEYPIMHVVPSGVSFDERTRTWQFELFFLDKPPSEDGDKSEYQADSLSDTAEICGDFIASIQPGILFGDMVSVNLASSAQPLIQEFKNVLTGWQLSIAITVPALLDSCNIPGSFTFIDPTTGATGNAGQMLGFGKIEVQGQSTVEAEISNDTVKFIGAGGMTITTNAAGDEVTFTSEEGGGGTGDVVGPASSVDGRIALFDGTTGKLIKQASVGLDHFATAVDLTNQISAEQAARATADGALSQDIDDEIAARGVADSTLQTNINTEATTRASADTALQTNIDDEASTREAADLALEDSDFVLAAQLLGSAIKVTPLSGDIHRITTFVSLTDAVGRFMAIYVPKAMQITGSMFYQAVQGNYTADQTNAIGLYSYSAGTITKITETANDGNLWKKTSQSWHKEPFLSAQNLAAGIYFIEILYNNSAQTTAPGLGVATNLHSANVGIMDLTNSAKLAGSKSAQTSLSATHTMASITALNSYPFIALY